MYEIFRHHHRQSRAVLIVPGERLARVIVNSLSRLYAPRVGRVDDWDYVRYGQGW